MTFKSWLLLALLMISTGCQTSARRPTSVETGSGSTSLLSLYRDQIKIEQSKVPLNDERNPENAKRLADQISNAQTNLNQRKNIAARNLELSSSKKKGRPESFSLPFSDTLRTQHEWLLIRDLEIYAFNGSAPTATYLMSLSRAKEYWLDIQQEITTRRRKALSPHHTTPNDEGVSQGAEVLEASLRCDGPFRIRQLRTSSHGAGRKVQLDLYDRELNATHTLLSPSSSVRECELLIYDSKSPQRQYGVRLVADYSADQKLAPVAQAADVCLLPNTQLNSTDLSDVQKFFLTPDYLHMACPQQVKAVETLENAERSVQVKAETLLGRPLPANFIANQNPFAPLDFASAPKLDIIVVSYLVFRADFYGQLIARLLKFHADRGTIVRILVSNVIQLEKDRDLLYGLEASNPNIKLREYRYDTDAGNGGFIDQFHRTMHVKLLITYSAADPYKDAVFVGGRNIHDGFLFRTTPDYSHFPKMVNYAGGDESFVHWLDFESVIRDKAFTEKLLAHFFSLWEQNSTDFFIRSLNINLLSSEAADSAYFKQSDKTPLVRHHISIPYNDGGKLKDFYAELIDTAKHKLLISTPYFRPTEKVGAALRRAVDRGVDVTLITRIDLEGDTAGAILTDVNKDGINQFYKKIKIYEYTGKNIILHSKLVMIDGEMSYIGSVNLNKRSFYHDLENGLLVYSRPYTKKLEGIYGTYRKNSRLVTEQQKVKFLNRIIINIFDKEL